MSKTAVYDYSTTAASNSDFDGVDSSGATGKVKDGDNYARSIASHVKGFALDLGAVNTVGGTGDAITVTLASNPTALVDGMRFSINAPGTNTTIVTIAVTSSGAVALGTKKVRKWSGGAETALSAGDITSGHILNLVYDSARDGGSGAFMIDGSASVAAATTSAAGIVELATAQEALAAASSALALTPASIASLIQNINNNAFKIADLEGVRLNMAGGIADAYDSETDVDTATSTNERYDATNDRYSPTATTGAEQIPTMTSGTTSGVTMSASSEFGASNAAWKAGDKVTSGSGANLWLSAVSTDGNLNVDLGSSKTIATYTARNDSAYQGGCTTGWNFQVASASDYSDAVTVDSQTNQFSSGGNVENTYTISAPIAGRYVRWVTTQRGGGSGGYSGFIEVGLQIAGTPNNMTLVSNAFTASAVPTQARIAVFIDPQESITINTDFTAEASRDGGTTWTSITLAIVSNPVGTVEQYEGSASISSQPSGTSMKYRLKTLNNKDIDVTGIVFQWS